ncbi:hypothetical protein MKW94_020560 [Papaver nudicaule]|uniref:NAC domain-containing protein n=1 Tax=Papaver nudicaule TaxID=74823 RepID=A0AA42B3Z5_PAPNU|nr:hypothetical protein [Papaver nudicaule]
MEEVPILINQAAEDCIDLPPGFRFHPTDEEIISHYLSKKVLNIKFSATTIGEVDLNKCEPWDLPNKAKMGEKEWYFFCQRDRKYPTGMRTNRATEAGYWKATGKDKEIYKGKGCLVGMKKTLVFYKGRAPKGEKTNWVMHEFRLDGKFSHYNLPKTAKDEWVVCRVFHKNSSTTGIVKRISPYPEMLRMNSFGFVDDYLIDSPSSLPPLMDNSSPNYNSSSRPSSSTYTNEDEFKTAISGQLPYMSSTSRTMDHQQQQYNYNMVNHQVMMMNQFPSSNATPNTSMFYPQTPQNMSYLQKEQRSVTANMNAIPSFPGSSNFIPEQTILRALADQTNQKFDQIKRMNDYECKVEQQFTSNNQSMVSHCSQDTGLSNDVNVEISSVQHVVEDPAHQQRHISSDDVNLDYLWNY